MLALLLCAPPVLRVAAGDWLPINPEDLALKDNPKHPGAHAMILYRSSTINAKRADVDGDFTEEYIRIKIFTQEGTKEADREIEFQKDNTDVKDIRARTIRPDGSTVNFDGKVFERTVVKLSGFKFLAKTFTLPDVQPGCVIEYKYRRQGKPGYLRDQEWILSNSLYTREVHFTIIPYVREGGLPLFYRQFGLPNGVVPEKQVDGRYTMAAADIQAIEDEPFMPPEKALQARVEFYYRDMNEPTNETPEHFWARTGKRMNDRFEDYINKKGTLQKELARITSPGDPPETVLRKIQARVQQIRDLSFEEFKTEKERKKENLKDNSNVDDLLKHNAGDGREVDFLFAGLARAAGFEATEIYIANRDRSVFNPKLEDPSELNGDIVWVKSAGKEYWLDPSARFHPFGVLPWQESDTQGLKLNKQGGEFVNVPPPAPSDATIVRHADLEITPDGGVKGTLQVDFTGQQGAILRQDNRGSDETGRKKALTDHIKEWMPTNANFDVTAITNWDKADLPLHVEGTFSVESFGSGVGRRMLIPMTFFQSPDVRSFQTARRVNSIYFHFPYQETDEIRIHAPAGYRIESVPAAKQHKPGVVSYELSASQAGDVFVVKRRLEVGGLKFPQNMYRPLQAFFNSVKTDDEAQFFLQRTESAKN